MAVWIYVVNFSTLPLINDSFQLGACDRLSILYFMVYLWRNLCFLD
jgi:hypothetical protein